MAKRKEEMKEIQEKMTEEINEEVVDIKGEIFMLRLQKSAQNEFKSSEFGHMHKRAIFTYLP
ncbi:50S ribosomal protein L29, chloroplastic [Canna indica]|uniref:Large ribosomal subunit protein uL29c n=1 Tax=Canna indica TaxID=4628 RepID=A0AAQ3Q207_9LILI|nr:50S ribosomal protein L29, chloroplastic [Canna indica]